MNNVKKKKQNKIEIMNLFKAIDEYKIKGFYCSNSLKHFENQFKKKFNIPITDLNNTKDNIIYFGLYDNIDYQNIISRNSEFTILIYGGTDVELKIINQYFNNNYIIRKLITFSISNNITSRLKKYNLLTYRNYFDPNFNLINEKIFKPVEYYGKNIYVYDGYNYPRDIYNLTLINNIKEKLPEFDFIHSSKINEPYENMPNIYGKCFIGLRLTENDGNANTVQEFKAMNIPIVHNQSDYGLKWNTIHDIIKYIKIYSKNIK